MKQKNGVRPLVFDIITKGPPRGLEKKILGMDQEDKEMINDSFEYGFKDSLEVICGVILILPTEHVEDYQNRNLLSDYAREDYFDDPSLSLKAVWVTEVSCFTPHRNVAVFDPPTDDMRCHMKPLHLTNMLEDQIINKILVDVGVAFNILPRSMLRRLGRTVEDLIPHNIVVSDFCGKPSDSEGVICLDVSIASRRRPIVVLVISLQANFNMLLGRE
ncbi:hypothetical protein D0Y65_015380 [Glycine soja]|uniref:Uncharacterized protein n=1 Tax=Glycine soja TaxID=3848 RepID=A0A445KCV3_GLYSO|nr:hypothetical protein D0Y65_015380 [Glycine soja]